MSDEDWDRSIDDHDYGALVCMYVACAIVTFIAVVFVRKLREPNAGQQPDDEAGSGQSGVNHDVKLVTRASIAAIFLYLLSTVLSSIALTKWIAIDQEHGTLLNYTLSTIANIPYTWNLMGVVPFVLLQRLNGILGNRCVHIFSFVLLAFGVILYPIAQTMIITAYSAGDSSKAEAIRSAGSLFVMICFIIYLVIACLYLHQISKVMKSRINSINIETRGSTNDSDDKKESDEAVAIVSFKTVDDMVRCALLVAICSVTNLLTPALASVGFLIVRHATHQSTLPFIAMATDIVFNTVCIYFLFRFATDHYFFWCKRCHACTMCCCAKMVVKGYRNKDKNWNDKAYEMLIANDIALE